MIINICDGFYLLHDMKATFASAPEWGSYSDRLGEAGSLICLNIAFLRKIYYSLPTFDGTQLPQYCNTKIVFQFKPQKTKPNKSLISSRHSF
jgi:hypothetical protein